MAEDEEKEGQEEVAGGKSKVLLFVLLGVVVLALGGGAAAYFLLGSSAEENAADGDAAAADGEAGADGQPPSVPETFAMDAFVVNIADGDKDRFLKLKVDLEVSGPAVSAELTERLPQVKDIMISVVSSQSFGDVRSLEGKDFLREELQTRLNAVVREGTVRKVFFTEFIVQ